jgi:threonine aldolase
MFFASDNASPVPPQIMAALQKTNDGYASSYGADFEMDEVRRLIREIFEAPEAEVYLVATGTAANVISLATLVQPWQAICCHSTAHISVDECGSPEFYTGGAKLALIDGDDGKITPAALKTSIGTQVQGFVHSVQHGALSLTNATENGTVYSAAELKALCDIAKSHGMGTHLDGARFANSVVSTGATPAEMSWKAGIDVLSFGGTKNGLMGVEAVILFDPKLAWEFELRRKRGGHLFSKHRYLSAQMLAYLTDGLWLDLAAKANASATKLSKGILKTKGSNLLHPTQANAVFASWSRKGHRAAHEAGAKYYFWNSDENLEGPDDDLMTARLVSSWCTTDQEIDAFLALIS